MPAILPDHLEDPGGLVLRRWRSRDAKALSRAVSGERRAPATVDGVDRRGAGAARGPPRARFAEWERDWSRGGDELFLGVFLDGQVAGGCGLHRRIGDDGLEIGYWIHLAYRAARAGHARGELLTDAAFTVPGITHVEIHHDKANRASGGVPRKLGFHWVGEAPDEPEAPADLGIEWRWRIGKDEWLERRPGVAAAAPAGGGRDGDDCMRSRERSGNVTNETPVAWLEALGGSRLLRETTWASTRTRRPWPTRYTPRRKSP